MTDMFAFLPVKINGLDCMIASLEHWWLYQCSKYVG